MLNKQTQNPNLFWVSILLLPTVFLLPVLIWPHYGLFSDAIQLIQFPQIVLEGLPDTLRLFGPLEDGRWNPIFHGLSVLIYSIAPDSARVFYIAQWLMLISISLSLAWITLRVSGSRLLSLISLSIFLTSSSFFENFYTLDKVEPRVTFFLALYCLSFLGFLFKPVEGKLPVFRWPIVLGHFVLGVLIVFSKETGIFLAAGLGAVWVISLLNQRWVPISRTLLLRFFVIQLLVVLAYLLLFKLLAPPMSYRYVTYDFSPSLVLNNIKYYVSSSPELALGLLLASYWTIQNFVSRISRGAPWSQVALTFISCALIIYFMGISLWRWPLDYYLLPAHFLCALLIPLSLYALLGEQTSDIKCRLFYFFIAILLIAGLAHRLFIGIAIYNFDALKDDLAHHLSDRTYTDANRLVLPFTHPGSVEVGERLEFFVNRARESNSNLSFFNFWEIPYANRSNLQRFQGGAALTPSLESLRQGSNHPEKYLIWSFDDEAWEKSVHGDEINSSIWNFTYLAEGDLIVVPTGSSHFHTMRTRGLSMHSRTGKDFLQETMLDLSKVGGVKRTFLGSWIGWDIYKVNKIPSDMEFQGYTKSLLMALNKHEDITPAASINHLTTSKTLPKAGVFLGHGWHEVEMESGRPFRWMGKRSELVVTNAPKGICALSFEAEPLQAAEPPSEGVALRVGGEESVTKINFSVRNARIEFESTGDNLQVLELEANGGANLFAKNDPRELVLRVFDIQGPNCSSGS